MLKVVGERLREARQSKGWSVREVSARSGVSERFVFAVEGGRANVSLKTLGQLTEVLELPMIALFTPDSAAPPPRRVIALLGMRGAGKSAVGPLLAQQLNAPFVELDERVEALAGLPLADIFALHGAAHYEALQLQALRALCASSQRVVVATGGGIVTCAPALSLLRERAHSVWLRASPLAHWERVIAQGDWRPIEGNPRAYEQLCATLDARTPLYAAADWVEDTDARAPGEVARGIAAWVERAAPRS
jgi:XRE family transcriptional regulator, aerobic/anaerobic benzoate catabolism transcriptional regulator